MIERHLSADKLNLVVNDPYVFPWVCGGNDWPLDLTPVAENISNFVLMGEHGGVVFLKLQPGIYEAHTQVLRSGRGRWTIQMVTAALHYMFTRTDAVEIITKVPHGNVAARALVKMINGTFEFTNRRGWVKDGATIPADIYALRIQDWMNKAPELPALGEWFHDKLESEYKRLGVTEEQHEDDETHDRYVGAAVSMMASGQPHKGAVFYNRWARQAGYKPCAIVSEHPLAVDIQDAVLIVRDGDFWVATVNAAEMNARAAPDNRRVAA